MKVMFEGPPDAIRALMGVAGLLGCEVVAPEDTHEAPPPRPLPHDLLSAVVTQKDAERFEQQAGDAHYLWFLLEGLCIELATGESDDENIPSSDDPIQVPLVVFVDPETGEELSGTLRRDTTAIRFTTLCDILTLVRTDGHGFGHIVGNYKKLIEDLVSAWTKDPSQATQPLLDAQRQSSGLLGDA